MSIFFEAAHGSSIDKTNNIEIFQPRIHPTGSPDEIEYQYSIYQGEKRYGLGCLGICRQPDTKVGSARITTLNLGEDWVIQSMLKLKRRLCNHDDGFTFIMNLARGLVLVFKNRTDNTEAVQYIALTKESTLAAHGIVINETVERFSVNEIILSKISLPAHSPTGRA